MSSISLAQPRLQSTAQHGNDIVAHNTEEPVSEQRDSYYDDFTLSDLEAALGMHDVEEADTAEVVPVEMASGNGPSGLSPQKPGPSGVEPSGNACASPREPGPSSQPSGNALSGEPGPSSGEPSGNALSGEPGPSGEPSAGEPGASSGISPPLDELSPPPSPGDPGPSSGSGLSRAHSLLPDGFRFGLDRAPPPGWTRSKRAWERSMFNKHRKRGQKRN